MKRTAKILLASCMAAAMLFALTACNKDSGSDDESKGVNIEGTWKKSVNTKEVTNESGVQFYKSYLEDNPVTWIVKSDGTLKMEVTSASTGKKTINATWSSDGNNISVVDLTASESKQRTSYIYDPDDGYIYFKDEAESVYRFEKK